MTTVLLRQVFDSSFVDCLATTSTTYDLQNPIVLDESLRELLISHLQSLTPDDRYDRFSIYMDDAALVRYADGIDFNNDVCLGVLESATKLAGIIHLCVHNQTAELGASVIKEYRGQGFCLQLFNSAFKSAIKRGISEIHLATGHPAACWIAKKLGYSLKFCDGYPNAIISLK